ncbi:MAG: MobA/MobL family protein [Alphaproteobacteria bacterium]|nr:MobA/MobL family protein [Alphaproteobacteria bacterium]
MAIYSLNLGFISRSEGRSAVGFSAYISASHQLDERTGILHDYACKEDVIVSRILAPEEAPAWAKNAVTLWNHVEAFEDHFATLRFRGDASNPDKNQKSLEAREHFLNTTQTAQTIMGALPLEFTQLEAEVCVEEFLRERFVSRGLVVQYAIHWDKGNPHFHGLITRRALEGDAFAFRKDRDIVSKAELLITRKAWEEVANKHLALGGHEVRIDCRSYANQGLDLLPSRHEGWYAQRLAERGEYSRIVSENEEIRQKNIEILCKNPGALIHEVSLKRTVFTRQHLEEEILRRVGGDEKLFALLQVKVEGVEIPPELILKQANDNRRLDIFEGTFAPHLQKLAAQFTESLLENTDMVAAVGENLNREKIFASASYQQQEEYLLHLGENLSQRQTKTVSEELVLKAIEHREEELGFELSEEQRGAIFHLCSGSDISILNGKAGTGKTTLLKAVAEAYRKAGYEVLGTAFQGKVVDIMEQEIGIPCRTLDSFIYVWNEQKTQKDLVESGKLWGRPYIYAFNSMKEMEKSRFTEKNVIIVDEANMIGGRLWEPFLKEAVEKGAKVLIVQDPAQIKSRDPGDYGRLFAERYGIAETTEVVRQRVEWQRKCSKYLNDHEVLDGLKPYYDKGHLTWFDAREKVITALAQSYVKDQLKNPDQTRIALAYRNTEVYDLNQAIRHVLQEHGQLQQTFQLHGQEYAIGDRIRFTQNDNHGQFVQNLQKEDKSKGVKNGTFGTIETYDENSATLTVRLENNRLVSFNTTAYTKITHGYAMGVHKSEGSTFDKSFLSLDPLLDPRTFLVAMTRHRHDVQVFINREQFIDFKDVVDRIGRVSLKETIQDYTISEDQKPYFDRIQQYKDLLVEGVNLREEMEGALDPKTPLYKHPSYPAYQTCFEEKKRVANTILEDWKAHAPCTRLAGLRKDVLEAEIGLRPRLLSDLEYRASLQVQGYMDLLLQTRTLWKEICQTHPASLSSLHHRYEEYKSLKIERDSLAFVFQENRHLYAPFFRTSKDETSGEIKDFWGETITNDSRITWTGVKSHAEAHFKSQKERLTYERIPDDQKPHFDVVKEYVQTRNEAATVYGHMQKQKETPAQDNPVQEKSPQSIFTLEKFHELQKRRDELALKIVDSPSQYQPFFDTLKIKEDKLLTHAVAGELREKVALYGIETNPEKRSQQAIDLKRILTTSKDYRFLKESGIDANRLTFDIAFYDKIKAGEIPKTLHPEDVYKPIQNYLKASQESAQLWKVLNSKVQDPPLQKQLEAAFQARNENASQLVNNPVALSVILTMRPDLSARINKQANWRERDTVPQLGGKGQWEPKDFTKTGYSVDHVLQATKGQTLSIASELLGEPNSHMSNKTTLRFRNKGSLVVNVSGAHEGLWKDFETGEGGNIIQLVQREKNFSFKDSLSYLGDRLKVTPETILKPSAKVPLEKTRQRAVQQAVQQIPSIEDAKERASRLNSVSELQMKSKQIHGTLAETYLRKERGIQGELSFDLRYLHKGSTFIYQGERKTLAHDCLAAFGRTETGSLSSVQLTKLDAQGNRARTSEGEKLTKIQYGLAKGSFVTLQEDESNVSVFIAEGVETALSLKEAGLKGTIVASLGIHNMANYKGPEKEIILCGDNDAHKENSKTHSILEVTKENFEIQGKSVLIIKPSHPGDDFNDVLKKEHVQGVRGYLKSYLDPEKQMKVQHRIEAQTINNGKQSLAKISRSTASHLASASQSLEVISDYIQSKMRDIKAYEGTSLAHEAKDELRNYLTTLQKNDTLLQDLKDQNKELIKEAQKIFQEQQQRIKIRGMEM